MNLNDLELSHGTCSACGREDSSMQRLGRLVFDVFYVGFAAVILIWVILFDKKEPMK